MTRFRKFGISIFGGLLILGLNIPEAKAGGIRNYGLFFATVPVISLATFTLIWSAFQEPKKPEKSIGPQTSVNFNKSDRFLPRKNLTAAALGCTRDDFHSELRLDKRSLRAIDSPNFLTAECSQSHPTTTPARFSR